MKSLIVGDVQNDFLPGGALPVPEGDQVVPVANRLTPRFPLVVGVQDWHPPDHGSFASQHPGKKVGDVIDLDGLPQILWPDHCIQHTPGAAFAPGLDASRFARVFWKGTDRNIDSYSAFFDNGHRKSTGLGDYLRERGVTDLYVLGLATDYCVRSTVLDALSLGFRVFLIEDGCRGVELRPGDCAAALHEMQQAGAQIIRSEQVVP